MMKYFWELGVLLLLPIATLQRSNPSSLSYVGAVAEYSPVRDAEGGKNIANTNADNYLKFIEKASQYFVDIIVFPESSLSTSSSNNITIARSEAASYIPDPKDNIIPCNDDKEKYAYSLKTISCAARNYSMYVVVNHQEKTNCSGSANCPADGFIVYNTNVAFDRNGQVIARYRKYNLYGEWGVNRTSSPEISTFTTDFGVTFGQFICFDILFETPTLNYTRDFGITDVVFSAHWFSELPYLFSTEAQAAWSHANDVNFLASGYNNPQTASGGSGIYIGRQGYAKVISEDKASNILVVSEIPKVINGKRSLSINNDKMHVYRFTKLEISTSENVGSGKYLHKTDDVKPYTTQLINLKQKSYNTTLCDRGLCCEFKLKIDFDEEVSANNSNYYRYRLSVFNGTRSFTGVATGGIKTCGIISCINDFVSGCGELLDPSKNPVSPTTFHSLEVTMRDIRNERSTFFMPISFSKSMLPLNATDFSYGAIDTNGTATYSINLTKPRSDLLTLAIYGRNFVTDGTDVTSSSGKFIISPLLILSTILAYLFTYYV